MVRDGLESIYALSIENPYTIILCLLAEHLFCFLRKYIFLVKYLNNNCSEVLVSLTLYSTPILKLTLLAY